MNRLFIRNDAKYRLLRTIIQGIIGVIIANLDYIVGATPMAPELKTIIVALIMAVLSPVMAALGTEEVEKEELPDDYFEGAEDEEDEEGDDWDVSGD